jgi:cyclohexanone monooxygenase
VVGTGATAVQAIPEIAQQAKHLTVFQRTANYCVPARNGKVDPDVVKARKADYEGVVKRLRESFFGQEHYPIPKSALDTTPEEREREFDRMWDAGGFAFWLANYQDMFVDQAANDLCRLYQAQDPLDGGTRRRREAHTPPRPAPSVSRWTPTITRPSTRTTCG